MSSPGADALRIGAIILIAVAGALLVAVFIAGVYRLWRDCKDKKEAKRAAQERHDFESYTYDLGLDEIDRLSSGSSSSLYDRNEPVIQELHFPVTRANEVHMANNLQTVGHLSAFTNVSPFYNDKGWGSPSHQALYKADDRIIETDFSKAMSFPAWHTGAPSALSPGNIYEEGNRNKYLAPRDVPRANMTPMNNFVALQMASQSASPYVQHSRNKISPLASPAVNQAREREQRRKNDMDEYAEIVTSHTNAYYINDANRPGNVKYPGIAQSLRDNEVYGNYRAAPVLNKDAEYWHYVGKTKTPTPDLSAGHNPGARKGGNKGKGHKNGKSKAKQRDYKHENPYDRGSALIDTRQGNSAWDMPSHSGAGREDITEAEADQMRPLGRTERSLSTKKKEDLLVSELKARLGKRHGTYETEEMIF